jgi:hypothetical protein
MILKYRKQNNNVDDDTANNNRHVYLRARINELDSLFVAQQKVLRGALRNTQKRGFALKKRGGGYEKN